MKNKLWGGRFNQELHPLILEFTRSIDYDWFLLEYEALADIAWVKQLYQLKLITSQMRDKIVKAIKEIIKDYSLSRINVDLGEEDVHSFFYKLLRKKVGKLVDRIHAGKSRNEQIVTIMRMFLKDMISQEIKLIIDLQKSMLKKAQQYYPQIIPGFTHLQYAQPVLFSHWLLSYVEELERDKQRLKDCFKRVDILPLGSGALAGDNLRIDRERIRKSLTFSTLGRNSIDMVSDRDFILEYLNCNLILLLHLSRFSEDLIIYNSPGYNFITFSDKVTTGSSLMPHKKNPDPLELVRASCAQALSSYVFLADILKGLPSSYNRDLQLDKKALFASSIVTTEVLEIMTVVLSEMSLKKNVLLKLLQEGRFYAPDIAEELIKKGVPWKEAHKRVGSLVKYAEDKGKDITELESNVVKRILGKDILVREFFDAYKSVNKKSTLGSTNPALVLKEITRWKKLLSSSRF